MSEINKANLSEQTKFRLSEITGIENNFHQEINQRKLCIKKLSKYVTAFDYIDKIFNYFKRNKWWKIYNFFYKHCGSTSRNSNRKFYFNFFFDNRNNQKFTKHNKKRKEKIW